MKRRVFLESIAALPVLARASAPAHLQVRYVARRDCIDVFEERRGDAKAIQSVPSIRPVFLTLHPNRQFLLAVNHTDEYQGLPTGSVECFAVIPATGHLSFIGRQPLSLSSTFPRHCAVSPDGKYLVVAAYGGGTLNVLPIRKDGTLGPVCQVIKEIGRGGDRVRQASAHPHSVAFHPSGAFVITTDLGSDCISVFGFEQGRMTRVHREPAPPGSGPADIRLNRDGSVVTVVHHLKPLVAHYSFDSGTGTITKDRNA
jgi:6-phosphogluconolactonase (cycloisomerase 2 family)